MFKLRSEASLQKHASEASLQKLHFRSTLQKLQKHYFRSTLQKLHFSCWLLFQYKAHVTWICVQESTFAWINQAIKAYTRIMSKRIFNVHLRLIFLDVKITALHCCFTIRIWLHQMVVLQIILSETKWNILKVRMFSSAHACFMNNTVGEKQKGKSKSKSVLLNQR